jgi:hypothetical protein
VKAEENRDKPRDGQCHELNLNRAPYDHKVKSLLLEPLCAIAIRYIIIIIIIIIIITINVYNRS